MGEPHASADRARRGDGVARLALDERAAKARTAPAMLAILRGPRAAPQFHNNYVPWFSLWMVLAAAEALPARPGSVQIDRDSGGVTASTRCAHSTSLRSAQGEVNS